MKILSWLFATLFFLAAAGTTLLLVREAPSWAEENGQSVQVRAEPEVPADLREEARKAFAATEALIAREKDEVESRTRKSVTPELKDALTQWEANESIREALGLKIADELQVARASQKLDLLLLVTQDNEVFSAEAPAQVGVQGDRQALAKAAILLASEAYFRDGKASSGFESFPSEHGSSAAPGEERASTETNVFIAAGTPIWLRADAPHSVLMGGISMQTVCSLAQTSNAAGKDKLRWHAFLEDKALGPVVFAGARSSVLIRRGCYQALLKDGITEEGAFEDEALQFGRWGILRSRDSQVLGGWGVTIEPAFLKSRVNRSRGESPPALASFPHFAREWGYYAAGATALLGLAYLGFLYGSFRHRRRRYRARILPALEHSKPIVPPPPQAPKGDDLVSQFEINWKTFASYTQDLLHQKLKELEAAPQRGVKEVREQVTRLAEALTDMKKDLADARSEVRDTRDGVVEKVAHLVAEEARDKNELSAGGEALLKKIEGDFERATSRFSQLDETVVKLADVFGQKQDKEIEDRVRAEVAKLEAQWNKRVEAFSAEIQEAKQQGQLLHDDLKKASDTEGILRGELQAAAEREKSLRGDVASRDADLDQAAKERETAWRREREVIEELHTAKAREEEKLAKIAGLETAAKGLEASIAEGGAREEELARDADEARAQVAKLEEAIKEIYRQEGRFQQDLERKEKEFEKERLQLGDRLRTIESRNVELEARTGESSEERARLGELASARQVELEALQRALEAIKEEKGHFERVSKGLGEEVEGLRAERTTFNDVRFGELEEANARLGGEIALLEKELHKERHDNANVTQSLEMHKIELVEQASLLARTGEEIKSLREELEQRAVDLERTRKVAESKVDEYGPAKAALEKALQGSIAELKRVRDSAEAREAELRSGREANEKAIQAARVDSERLEKASKDQQKRLRESDEERFRLRAKLAEMEAQWRSRLNELELRAADAARKLADSERRLAEAESMSRGLRMNLDQAKITARAGDDMVERMRSLEREKTDLAGSLDRLSKELERVRMEAEGVRRFQGTLVDGCIPAAIVAFDTDLKVFAWNPRAEGLWNRPASSVLSKTLEELGIKGIGRELIELSSRAIDERRSVSVPQSSFSDEQGKVRHVCVSCDPILGPQGEAIGAVLVADEITEKVENEIEARLQNLFSQSLTRSLPGALVVVDTQRRVISWNRSAETILGVPEKSALGEDFFSLATPLARDAFKRHFEESRKDRLPHRIRVRLDQRGVPTQFVVTQSPFLGSDDTVRGAILLIQETVDAVEARK